MCFSTRGDMAILETFLVVTTKGADVLLSSNG